MTSQQKDKYIVEKLGKCWHNMAGYAALDGFHCRHCGKVFSDSEYDFCNPDFESEAGIVQLLKLVQRHGWIKFIQYYESPLNILLDLTDDTGKFRDEVFRWMGGEG